MAVAIEAGLTSQSASGKAHCWKSLSCLVCIVFLTFLLCGMSILCLSYLFNFLSVLRNPARPLFSATQRECARASPMSCIDKAMRMLGIKYIPQMLAEDGLRQDETSQVFLVHPFMVTRTGPRIGDR